MEKMTDSLTTTAIAKDLTQSRTLSINNMRRLADLDNRSRNVGADNDMFRSSRHVSVGCNAKLSMHADRHHPCAERATDCRPSIASLSSPLDFW